MATAWKPGIACSNVHDVDCGSVIDASTGQDYMSNHGWCFRWAYDQTLDVLIKGYRPGGTHALGVLLHANEPANECAGTLGDALLHVAQRISPAPEAMR